MAVFKQVHRPAALRLPGLRDNPSPGHPGRCRRSAAGQEQRRRFCAGRRLRLARPTIRAACR
ncbi:hypothetical protein IE969_24795 [Klebsiella pneumoniae]|nr:hypothetical protein [Klebsiella pneumoniae]